VTSRLGTGKSINFFYSVLEAASIYEAAKRYLLPSGYFNFAKAVVLSRHYRVEGMAIGHVHVRYCVGWDGGCQVWQSVAKCG
jgi:hypothetical protein